MLRVGMQSWTLRVPIANTQIMKKILILILILLANCNTSKINNIEEKSLLIAIVFDDNHPSIYNIAFAKMQEYNISGTNYIVTNWVDNICDSFTLEQLKEMEAAGWETAGHTTDHTPLAQVSLDSVRNNIEICYNFLIENNLTHNSFAFPHSSDNEMAREIIAEYFKYIRDGVDYQHYAPLNPHYLGYFPAHTSEDAKPLMERIAKALDNGENVLFLGFHQIVENEEDFTHACTPEEFYELLDYINKLGLETVTVSEAVERLQ